MARSTSPGSIRAMVRPSVRMACWRLKVSAAMRRKSGFLGSKRGMVVSRYRRLGRQMSCRDGADRALERHGLVGLAIEMHGRDLAGGDDLAGLGIAHFMQEADGLFAQLQQPASDLDNVAGKQLALVADVLLHAGHTAAGLPEIARRQTKPREHVPVGLVELADVPHDVHVADMVALPRIDRAAIGGFVHRNYPR